MSQVEPSPPGLEPSDGNAAKPPVRDAAEYDAAARWIFRVIGSGLILVAFALAYWLIVDLRRGLASPDWPTTDGQLVRVEVKEASRSITRRWQPIIEFRYQVGDKEYTGDRFRAGGDYFAAPAIAQAFADRYTRSTPLKVHYDPSDPSISLLAPGARWTDWAWLIAPPLMLAAGLWLASTGWSRRRRSGSQTARR